MNIGIFGLWGMNLPGMSFGGFETAFSEIGAQLVRRGHRVVIYCRRERYPPDKRLASYRGVRLKYMPTIDTKSLSAISATWAALLDSLRGERFDVYLFANVGMGYHCLTARLLGQRVALNVDGLDWQRAKWGPLARAYYRTAARCALWACQRLITDSRVMQAYYREHFHRDSAFIPYGAEVVPPHNPALLERFGVAPRQYLLIVSRFVPENNLELLIQAFTKARTPMKLLVVGGTPHPTPYEQRLRAIPDERVLFPGYVNDRATLEELLANCYAYLHGHSVGGTNPVLLDALGAGCCILALDTPFSREVLAGHGLLFPRQAAALREQLQRVLDQPALAAAYRQRAPERVAQAYRWDRVVDSYEALLQQVARRPSFPCC